MSHWVEVGSRESRAWGSRILVKTLRLAFSPCPNDTFIFHAWVHGLVPGAPPVEPTLADIDELNAAALLGEPDVVKLSFHALVHVLDTYALLHAGGALGRGCGPLVVTSDGVAQESTAPGADGWAASAAELASARIAVPGALTTAALLLRLFAPAALDTVVMPFDRIMPAVAEGEVDAGVIIHESRFTYPLYGLRQVVDLGEWWESSTGHPIPLGGIAVRRSLGRATADAVDRAIRASLEVARRDPSGPDGYVRAHSQEMDADVCRQHIDLYVTGFSVDYGAEGEAAIRHLLDTAERRGIVPPAGARGLFWDD